MIKLEDAICFWEESGHHGTRQERLERGKAWLPYYAYLAAKHSDEDFTPSDKPDEFVDTLLAEHCIEPGDSVLDIGAGMGNYSLLFARAGCSVTALDASGPCLELLKKRARICRTEEKIQTVCSSWEEYIPKKRFDLVFTSMCPAICSFDELLRMEELAKKACCIITVSRGSYDKHRKAIMAEKNIRPSGGMVTEALHYINALYLSGRQLQMKSKSVKSFAKVSEEAFVSQYSVYFRIFGIDECESVPFLKKYFKENSRDGFLEDESLMKLAMLYWKV